MEGYEVRWGNMKMGCHSKAQQTSGKIPVLPISVSDGLSTSGRQQQKDRGQGVVASLGLRFYNAQHKATVDISWSFKPRGPH